MFGRKKNKDAEKMPSYSVVEDKSVEDISANLEMESMKLSEIIKKEKIKENFEDASSPTVELYREPHVINIGLESNIGMRKYQQDSAIASTDSQEAGKACKKTIAILCDGMGGMENGEIASNYCTSLIYNDFISEDIKDYMKFLKDEAFKVDDYVSRLVGDDGSPINAGSTLVAVIIENNKLFWISVGDSRIYIIRDDKIIQATTDHNYFMVLMEDVKAGKITLEEAQSHKDKEALVSYIGMGGLEYIDVNKKPLILEPDDYVILCSDGLYRSVDEDVIKYITVQNGDNTELAAEQLVEQALSKRYKNQDNTSVIVMKYN